MRFEPRHTFASARAVAAHVAFDELASDLAFLERFGVARSVLQDAAARALWDGTDGRRALLAAGAVSEALYYHALAASLDVPFVSGWPHLAEPCDPRATLLRGWARLVDGRLLVAPESPAIRTLLAARSRGLPLPRLAITTPSHLAALASHRGHAQIARRASLALPEAAPRLSACGALTIPGTFALVAGLLALLAGLVAGSHLESDVIGLVFLAGLVFRLRVFADGLSRSRDGGGEAAPDHLLPAYSVLVPLRNEAEMVPALVASLAALDYPQAKREVLFLIEPDDPDTRAALQAARLPAGFRIIDLPPGAPRTKPRALNVGLLLARGELVTIYDAEDRPEPDQLRRAAARFAHAPASLACLQARLAISNESAGLLPHGILEHPPQALRSAAA